MPSANLARDDDLRRLAATVPALLSVRVETATDTVTDAVTGAVEQIAEALLGWHDWLVGGPSVELHLADGLAAAGSFRPRSRVDTAELSTAAQEFRRCAASIQRVVQTVADDAARRTGQELSDVVRVLGDLLGEHVDQVREFAASQSDDGQSTARLSVAERSLYRKVIATLR